jgi:hypothetical protein
MTCRMKNREINAWTDGRANLGRICNRTAYINSPENRTCLYPFRSGSFFGLSMKTASALSINNSNFQSGRLLGQFFNGLVYKQ